MRTVVSSLLGVMLVCGGWVSVASGQAPAASTGGAVSGVPAGTLVAVIDVESVFKNYPQFNEQVEGMKAEVRDFDAQVSKQRDSITQRSEALKDFRPGSPEFKKLESDLAREMSQLQVTAQLKRKEIMEREAQVFYTAYQEILNAVTSIAQANGIGLVLRFDGGEMDPSDRASVLAGVSRAVVYQRQLDITQLVLSQLKQ